MSAKKNYLIFIALVAVFSVKAQGQVNTTLTTIKEIYSYSEAGDGDMLIVPEHPLPQCDGFWLDSATPGFMHNVSLVLSLYHTGSTLVIYGDENKLFSGSSNKFCKLLIMRLKKS